MVSQQPLLKKSSPIIEKSPLIINNDILCSYMDYLEKFNTNLARYQEHKTTFMIEKPPVSNEIVIVVEST